MWQTKESWSCERRVVAKAEALVGKTNPRFVVTNLLQDQWPAKALYEDLYCARGDMENRIKEHQLQLFSIRTSCHQMRANQMRLWLSTFAYLFFVELRTNTWKGTLASHWEPATIRLRVLKVAATVTVSTRRTVIQLPRSHPWWEWFAKAVCIRPASLDLKHPPNQSFVQGPAKKHPFQGQRRADLADPDQPGLVTSPHVQKGLAESQCPRSGLAPTLRQARPVSYADLSMISS